MENKIKVAVIGYGNLGKWHCDKADSLEDAHFHSIVEPDPVARSKAKEKYPNVLVVSDVNEVIDDIDAAAVVTPTSFHYEIVKLLLSRGKHVLCEKPLTSNSAQAENLKALIKNTNLVLQVGHSERFHKVWENKSQYAPFFKRPGTVRMNRLAPFKGRATDVDVVQDLMIHDLDLLVHLFEEIPETVKSTGYKIRTDKWDYVHSTFNFSSGRKATLTCGRNHIEELRSLEITNETGCLFVDLFKNEIKVAQASATSEDTFVQTSTYPKRDHLYLEHQAFYHAIKNSSSPVIDIEDGLIALRLIDKVLESLESGQVTQISAVPKKKPIAKRSSLNLDKRVPPTL